VAQAPLWRRFADARATGCQCRGSEGRPDPRVHFAPEMARERGDPGLSPMPGSAAVLFGKQRGDAIGEGLRRFLGFLFVLALLGVVPILDPAFVLLAIDSRTRLRPCVSGTASSSFAPRPLLPFASDSRQSKWHSNHSNCGSVGGTERFQLQKAIFLPKAAAEGRERREKQQERGGHGGSLLEASSGRWQVSLRSPGVSTTPARVAPSAPGGCRAAGKVG
jgi:hypothetical protein